MTLYFQSDFCIESEKFAMMKLFKMNYGISIESFTIALHQKYKNILKIMNQYEIFPAIINAIIQT